MSQQFSLIYHDDEDGRFAARIAVDRWFVRCLIPVTLWSAFYDRIDLGPCKNDVVVQIAITEHTAEQTHTVGIR